MARPAKPVAGTDITAGFGAELRSYASEAMEFIRVPADVVRWDVNDAAGTGSFIEVELTRLPANDPSILYAAVFAMNRTPTAGVNTNITLKRGATASGLDGLSYSFGTASRGGMGGPFMCRLGGTNGRSIWWNATSGSDNWITVVGYWRRVG